MRFYLFFLVITTCAVSACGQSVNKFVYKKIDPNILTRISNTTVEKSAISPRDLTEFLPKGYVIDGSVDYTEYIQEGINKFLVVKLPNFPLLINPKGLSMNSNSQLFFQANSKLLMKPNAEKFYQLIDIKDIQNVSIYNPVLVGDRKKHLNNLGEWGMGISIKSSQNIKIYNHKISECWGDGIYIGRSSQAQPSGLQIIGGHLDHNRRNGISIVSGRDILLDKIVVSNTEGTAPMAGIDIEPNNNEDVLENIKINSPVTYNNAKAGIGIILIHLIGKRQQNVDIKINGHKDFYSGNSLLMPGLKSSYANGFLPLGGLIEVNDPTWESENKALSLGTYFKFAPKYKVSNLKVTSKNKLNSSKTEQFKKQLQSKNIQIK